MKTVKNTILNAILPYPPSVNNYWRMCNNRVFVSSQGVAFRNKICAMVKTETSSKERLSVFVTVNCPDKRKRDIDNILKSLLDSLQAAGLYDNDTQIDKIFVKRGEIVKGGNVKVIIKELIKEEKTE